MENEKTQHKIKTDSLLRATTSQYVRLIAEADRKARIMVVMNSIFLTISITLLTKTIHHGPPFWISLMLVITSNLFALFFTIISVKPEIHLSIRKDTENNILHYTKASEYSLKEYIAQMQITLENNDQKLEAMIKELHYFGNLLTRQYKLLKMAYSCFYWGLVVSVVSYLVILLVTPQSAHAIAPVLPT